MNAKLMQLAERRERLVMQAAAQRTTLAHNIEPWRTPLALADQGLAALRYLKNHPSWIVGGIFLFAALRPGRVGKWLRRGWVAWQILYKLRGRKRAPEKSRKAGRRSAGSNNGITVE